MPIRIQKSLGDIRLRKTKINLEFTCERLELAGSAVPRQVKVAWRNEFFPNPSKDYRAKAGRFIKHKAHDGGMSNDLDVRRPRRHLLLPSSGVWRNLQILCHPHSRRSSVCHRYTQEAMQKGFVMYWRKAEFYQNGPCHILTDLSKFSPSTC